MFKLDDFEVHVLNAASVWIDPGGSFGLVPRALWAHFQTANEEDLIPMCQNCLLVKAHGKNILVDVGMGDKLTPKMREQWRMTHPDGTVIDGLARIGLQPADIDLVINTHLHGDHAAGNTRFAEDGSLVASFPNAEYVVQKREYEDAMQPNERTRATYFPINYEPLYETGQLKLLEGDTEFLPGIRGVVTPGHTPGHMSVIIERGDHAPIFFCCDLASYAVHFEKLGWMTAYDVEPLITLESKRKWQQWALETEAVVIFPHDVTMLAGRLTRNDEGKLRVVAVTEAVYS